LINNGGGGIFDFLPLARDPMARTRSGEAPGRVAEVDADQQWEDATVQDIYTHHIATPTGLDFAQAARLYRLEHEVVADIAAFRAALERALIPRPHGSRIIEVRTDRARNVALHRRAWEAVAGVLDGGA
jgi:2-succinyl-5-enolpyruvyl-6-hydroxy-3-cyclohexene-1-carboxylate synthase